MKQEFYDKLFSCNKCELSNREREKQYYGGDCKKKIMLVFQNPGIPKKKVYFQEDSIEDKIKKSREGFDSYWVKSKQKEFFRNFFDWVYGFGPDKDTYFRDLYITDSIKCQSNTEEIDEIKKSQSDFRMLRNSNISDIKKKSQISNCYDYLKEEISDVKPKIIVAFGSRTLDFFSQFDPKPVNSDEQFTPQANKMHGLVYRCDDFLLVPAGHISRIYMTLGNSYYDYLKAGLKTALRIKERLEKSYPT